MNKTLSNCIEAAWALFNNPNIEDEAKFRSLKILFIQASGIGYEAALKEIGHYGKVSPVFDVLKSELEKIKDLESSASGG